RPGTWRSGTLERWKTSERAVVAHQAVGADKALNSAAHCRTDKFLADVFGIDRQPRSQFESRERAFFPQQFQRRPRRFGIDEVRRERRHAAPVVDPGVEIKLVPV